MGCCIIVFIPYVAWVIGLSHRDPSSEEIDVAELISARLSCKSHDDNANRVYSRCATGNFRRIHSENPNDDYRLGVYDSGVSHLGR